MSLHKYIIKYCYIINIYYIWYYDIVIIDSNNTLFYDNFIGIDKDNKINDNDNVEL